MVKRLPTMQETRFDPWVGNIPWRSKWHPIPVLLPGKSHGVHGITNSCTRLRDFIFFFSCETFPYSNHRLYITQREKKHIFNFQKLLLQSKLEHLTLNNKLEGWKTKGWRREAPFLFLFHPRLIRKGQEKSTLWLESESESHSVVSNSLWLHGLYSPWNSPSKNTGVGTLSLLQGIFPTQGLNLVSHIAGGFFTS